jgi:hypothetical protein
VGKEMGTDAFVSKPFEAEELLSKMKELAKKCIESMNTYPNEYKKELPPIIDWLEARPCVRKEVLEQSFHLMKVGSIIAGYICKISRGMDNDLLWIPTHALYSRYDPVSDGINYRDVVRLSISYVGTLVGRVESDIVRPFTYRDGSNDSFRDALDPKSL